MGVDFVQGFLVGEPQYLEDLPSADSGTAG
jgi:hypothetical protein